MEAGWKQGKIAARSIRQTLGWAAHGLGKERFNRPQVSLSSDLSYLISHCYQISLTSQLIECVVGLTTIPLNEVSILARDEHGEQAEFLPPASLAELLSTEECGRDSPSWKRACVDIATPLTLYLRTLFGYALP